MRCADIVVMQVLYLAGKLGHGDTSRLYKPKVIDFFVGHYVRKVACGSQTSLALTSTGQVRLHQPKFITCFVAGIWEAHSPMCFLPIQSLSFLVQLMRPFKP